MNFTEQETAVLDFYRRENQGVIESEALAGLSLNTFRAARSRLVSAGALVVTERGRYVPVGAVTG
jgi:predicted transcriptional regulator of viral defense system